jgi:hypothetical protein
VSAFEGFLLSPGITPFITDASLVLYVLGPAIGAIVGGRRGLIASFAAVSVLVSIIKLVTDWSDLWDDVVSVAGLGAPLLLARADARAQAGEPPRASFLMLGAAAVALGFVKVISDFYDPFDMLVAFSAIIAGLALLRFWTLPGRAAPPAP